ncbi:MAG: tRNA pseudouridine(38-40) synthase TruA [Propionibacteriaceae bacterium]|jgi:tRNA pseudouridine38-40 synthase|nr:tRNA pseudouridine(38-40) synthase TruA [Propionibacteriaceae bacterium]
MRLRIDLAYDGTAFSGWARQPGLRTVQGVLEERITQVLRLVEPAQTVCAGRTDAGVHARAQVVHVDVPDEVTGRRGEPVSPVAVLQRRLPGALPEDIVIHAVTAAPAGFDARFSALRRQYVYRLWDSRPAVDPLSRGYALVYPHALDVWAMTAAADTLLGYHDFAAFCRPRETGTTLRTLLTCTPTRRDDGLIETTVSADAFCHSMVRSLMGALVLAGRGQRDQTWIEALLDARHRVSDIPVLPALGLTLEAVVYPDDDTLAARAAEARSRRGETGCPG